MTRYLLICKHMNIRRRVVGKIKEGKCSETNRRN